MKKFLIILASTLLLASCLQHPMQNDNNTLTGSQETNKDENESQSTGESVKEGDEVKVFYTLRDTDANGAIIDTNIENDELDPLKVLSAKLGEGKLIPGFEKNLIGMKVGEEKTFVVEPAEGYGEAYITQDFPYEQVAPVFTEKVAKHILSGKIVETQKKSDLNPEILAKIEKEYKVGDMIEDTPEESVKLTALTEDSVTIEVIQKTNPFLGKELTVGLEGSNDRGDFKIIAIDGDMATVEIANKFSPFYKKEFKEGIKVETESGTFEVIAIKEENGQKIATVKLPNLTHQLAGKTLHFTVKLTAINEKTTTEPEIVTPDFEVPQEEKTEESNN